VEIEREAKKNGLRQRHPRDVVERVGIHCERNAAWKNKISHEIMHLIFFFIQGREKEIIQKKSLN
jgi:hypothetical protein